MIRGWQRNTRERDENTQKILVVASLYLEFIDHSLVRNF
jgi:hypothetical protein